MNMGPIPSLVFETSTMSMRVCRCLDVDQTDSSILIIKLAIHSTNITLFTDGLISPKSETPPPRTRSNSRVRFDLDSNVEFPHEQRRRTSRDRDRRSYSDSEDTVTSLRREREREGRSSRRRGRRHRDPASQLFNDKYDRPPARDSDSEDDIEELPSRFDENGNHKRESTGNELADRIQDLLAGRGPAGKLFKGIAGSLMEEGERERERDGGGSGVRRRRRRESE